MTGAFASYLKCMIQFAISLKAGSSLPCQAYCILQKSLAHLTYASDAEKGGDSSKGQVKVSTGWSQPPRQASAGALSHPGKGTWKLCSHIATCFWLVATRMRVHPATQAKDYAWLKSLVECNWQSAIPMWAPCAIPQCASTGSCDDNFRKGWVSQFSISGARETDELCPAKQLQALKSAFADKER